MENIDKADTESRIFLKKNKLQSEIFSVCLCMREGLTNAVRHGHQNNVSKIITYSLIRNGNRLIMEIEDEGEAYDRIEDLWPDYPTKEDFFFNEDEY